MTKSMSAGAIHPIVDRTYKSTTRLQWVRELIVNSMQAKATWIKITTEWQAASKLGVHRRMVVDNGTGISREDMLKFFNKFGGSGKALGAAVDNFGIGFKVSALPWNRNGIVVIARQGEQVTLIWIHFDATAGAEGTGDYGAREFNIGTVEEPLMSVIVPLDEFDTYEIDGVDYTKVFDGDEDGLAVVLTGNDGTEDTIFGDPKRAESAKYDILQYLNGRFWDFPSELDIQLKGYYNLGDRATWPTDEDGCTNHTPYGMASMITKIPAKSEGMGTVVVPSTPDAIGAKLHWMLLDSPYGGGGDRFGLSLLGVRFASHDGINEIFHLAHGAEGRRLMSRFVKVSDVRDRLVLFAEVEESEGMVVFPDAGRTRLQWEDSVSGARELPWEAWHAYWVRNMPAEVRKAIEDYYAKLAADTDGGISDEDYKRLGDKYLDALKRVVKGWLPTRKVSSVMADACGNGGVGIEGGGARKRKVKGGDRTATKLHPVEGGARGARRGDIKLHLIKADVAPNGTNPAIAFDADNMHAVINSDTEVYKRLREYIVERYETSGQIDVEDSAQVDLVVSNLKRATEIHVSLALTEIYSQAHGGLVTADEATKMLDDVALGNILFGIRHIEEMASGFIGQALSGRKRLAAA